MSAPLLSLAPRPRRARAALNAWHSPRVRAQCGDRAQDAAWLPRRDKCGEKQEEFLRRCFYSAGQYDEAASFERLASESEALAWPRVLPALTDCAQTSCWITPYCLDAPVPRRAHTRLALPAAAAKMGEVEAGCGLPRSNRMFFLSIPPNVFIPAAGGAADFCSTRCAAQRPHMHGRRHPLQSNVGALSAAGLQRCKSCMQVRRA